MVQRAIVVMPALKTSCKLTRISQDGHSANDLLRLYSALKSLSILVIISGICQGLEIEGITVATMQMTFQSMTKTRTQSQAWIVNAKRIICTVPLIRKCATPFDICAG